MKIDRLPLRLLFFSTGLYLLAITGFFALSKIYRPHIPQPTEVTIRRTGTTPGKELLLRAAAPLPDTGQAIVVKYFAAGIPKYLPLDRLRPEPGEKGLYRAAVSGEIPSLSSGDIEGVVYALKPIEQPLIGFLLE